MNDYPEEELVKVSPKKKSKKDEEDSWGWNIDWDNGADEDEDFESGSYSGLADSLKEACEQISKRIKTKFTPIMLEKVDGALFGDIFTSDMNYNIHIEGPAKEIKKFK